MFFSVIPLHKRYFLSKKIFWSILSLSLMFKISDICARKNVKKKKNWPLRLGGVIEMVIDDFCIESKHKDVKDFCWIFSRKYIVFLFIDQSKVPYKINIKNGNIQNNKTGSHKHGQWACTVSSCQAKLYLLVPADHITSMTHQDLK